MKKTALLIGLTILQFNCNSQTKITYSLKEYLNSQEFDHLLEVESNRDTLKLHGYYNENNSKLETRTIKLNRFDVLGVNEWSFFYNRNHFIPLPISLTTVPVKIRPQLNEYRSNATSGISNIGINIDAGRWKTERYFANGKKSTHKLYVGIWVAPSVIELDSVQTRGVLSTEEKSKQLFLTTALTINYTYNNLTFTFVPFGFDIGTTSVGKNWIYNEKLWWGFGIGIEPKFLGAIFNK